MLTAKKNGEQLGFSEELSNTSKRIFLTDQEKIYQDKFADKEVLDELEVIMLIITGNFCRMIQRYK